MNFQNDETNGQVRVICQINHTKMIVVIPKSTQRIDFTMTLIMMNGSTPDGPILNGCSLILVLPSPTISSKEHRLFLRAGVGSYLLPEARSWPVDSTQAEY